MTDATALTRTFHALSDPTRRAVLSRLGAAGRPTPVGALADGFEMSLPAVLKHLRVLEEAGLMSREKRGRTVYCALEPAAMREAAAWLEEMEQFWTPRLDALAEMLERAPGEATDGTGEGGRDDDVG